MPRRAWSTSIGPDAVVVERVAALSDAVEPRQVIEQRIAGHRRQHVRTAGLAEQLEENGIRLTGARREHDSIRDRCEDRAWRRSRPRPRVPRAGRAAPVGRSAQPASARPASRSVGYRMPTRVGFDTVKSSSGPRAARRGQRERQLVGPAVVGNPRREHATSLPDSGNLVAW